MKIGNWQLKIQNWNWCLLALAAAFGAPQTAAGGALELVQERWGFDGRVVPEQINLLSLEIANRSPEPFQGAVRLFRADLLGGAHGAILVQDCYLTPGASRWVQFFPYVGNADEPWTLEWSGRLGREHAELKPSALGPPAWAVLYDESDPLPPRASLPLFADSLFPPTVSATDGCYGLVLAHAPRWEAVRQEAFLDWLRRGGQLHIVHGRSGRYPAFGEALAALNNPAERFRVGAGLVVRHPVDPKQLSAEALAKFGIVPPSIERNSNPRIYDFQEWLFERLASLAQPKHDWALIYLTILVYLALVGPVHYVYARKRRDYRPAVAFFLLTALGCSLLLGFLGQRGQNEAAAVHSISYARQIDANHYDVAQWGSAFVTSGAVYDLTHDAPHRLYAAAREGVRDGEIACGKEGHFRVDIPLNSAQSFLFRGKLKGPTIQLRVVRWEERAGVLDLALEPAAGFPTDCAGLWAVRGTDYYPLTLRGGRIECASSSQGTLEAFVGDPMAPYMDTRYSDEGDLTPEKVMPPLASVLINHSVGGVTTFLHILKYPGPDADRLRVFILARSPESFEVQGLRRGKRIGYALYETDVFKPKTDAGAP